jgi:hypothetical protein
VQYSEAMLNSLSAIDESQLANRQARIKLQILREEFAVGVALL